MRIRKLIISTSKHRRECTLCTMPQNSKPVINKHWMSQLQNVFAFYIALYTLSSWHFCTFAFHMRLLTGTTVKVAHLANKWISKLSNLITVIIYHPPWLFKYLVHHGTANTVTAHCVSYINSKSKKSNPKLHTTMHTPFKKRRQKFPKFPYDVIAEVCGLQKRYR